MGAARGLAEHGAALSCRQRRRTGIGRQARHIGQLGGGGRLVQNGGGPYQSLAVGVQLRRTPQHELREAYGCGDVGEVVRAMAAAGVRGRGELSQYVPYDLGDAARERVQPLHETRRTAVGPHRLRHQASGPLQVERGQPVEAYRQLGRVARGPPPDQARYGQLLRTVGDDHREAGWRVFGQAPEHVQAVGAGELGVLDHEEFGPGGP